LGDPIRGLVEYANVPRTIGAVVSAGKATLHECQTVYSIEDVYNLLELVAIDRHNIRLAEQQAQEGAH
jgi:hypothetical protein